MVQKGGKWETSVNHNACMTKLSVDRLLVRSCTALLWLLVGVCAVFWALRLTAPKPGALMAPVDLGAPVAIDTTAVARLLGAVQGVPAAAAPSVASRLVLLGVLAGRYQGGAALISVDGKPARPLRVGASLEEGLVLQSVQGRQALLGPTREGPASVTLEMVPLAR